MPPALYNVYKKEYYNSKDEMMEERRKRINKYAKLKYYKNKFKINIRDDEYDLFTNNFHRIKKILHIKEFLKNHHKNKIYRDESDMEIYAKNYQNIKNVEDLIPFINNLEII